MNCELKVQLKRKRNLFEQKQTDGNSETDQKGVHEKRGHLLAIFFKLSKHLIFVIRLGKVRYLKVLKSRNENTV